MMHGDHDMALAGVNVSRETIQRLHDFLEILSKWNKAINLVSKNTIADAWSRHVLDSAQIFGHGAMAQHWIDIGSGGGFPGLVTAVIAAEKFPDMRVTLIESDLRKAAFLREASRAINVVTTIVSKRAEDIRPLGGDVVSARALAPLSGLCALAGRHLCAGGTAIFLKGKTAEVEISEARKLWNFSLQAHTSITEAAAVVLVLKEISHV